MMITSLLAALFAKKPPENPGLENFLCNSLTPTIRRKKRKWKTLN